ncbi:MAG TPA: hypothetical protein VGR51_07080 [Thermoplasmata archaeon]|jgi:hypothetical protein|nr:hypothetical protein [Thermoplasmata archaeon]
MTDSVAKGNRLQVAARKLLEADGYTVHTAVRSVQKRGPIWISQTTDIFNAFDLIATRIEGPRPLRFIQITAASTSERIKKVDPVPINQGLASVEVWKWHRGGKRLDHRYKDTKVWLPRGYFQIYFKERNWEPHSDDRVFVRVPAEVLPAPSPAPPEPQAVEVPRGKPKASVR